MTIQEICNRWNSAITQVSYLVDEGKADSTCVVKATTQMYAVMSAIVEYLSERDSAFKRISEPTNSDSKQQN